MSIAEMALTIYLNSISGYQATWIFKTSLLKKIFLLRWEMLLHFTDINRNTLTTALNSQSKLCKLGQRYFVELIMLTLELIILQHGENFYKQPDGIITGDKESVSLANIAMHFATILMFPTLKKRLFIKDS